MSWNLAHPGVHAGWPAVPQFCGAHWLIAPLTKSLVLNDAEVLPWLEMLQVTSPVAADISALEISAFEMSAFEISALEISALVMSALLMSALLISALVIEGK